MQKIIGAMQEKIGVTAGEAGKIIEKAEVGGEISDKVSADVWLEKRFLPNCVLVDEEGYTKMCIDALKILGRTAPTDYGSSRQRDLGQLWADMTRGYLGEYAFKLFLKERWQIDADLGHEKGALADYLPMDIHRIKEPDATEYRSPRLKIGLKATKWNGIWLDIPGDQFNHSDIHVLIKVGAGRDHLLAFFKKISVFRDKILKRGQEIGSLSNGEAESLYESLPSFKPIPAYVCGFVRKKDPYSFLNYSGTKGRFHYTVSSWNGPIRPGDLAAIKTKEGLPTNGNVKFEGIGRFAHDSGYLFNTGSLLWSEKDWKDMCHGM